MRVHSCPRRPGKYVLILSNVLYWLGTLLILVFVPLYIVFFMIFTQQFAEYHTTTAKAGAYVHSLTGGVFYLCGFANFNSNIRQYFPRLHRVCGLIYYVMVIITSGGIIAILVGGSLAGESAVLGVLTAMPYWLWVNWEAYRSIKTGQVDRHRRFNLRSLVLGFSIILMRPCMIILIMITGSSGNAEVDARNALKVVLWWIFSWAFIGGEVYLWMYAKYVKLNTFLYREGQFLMLPDPFCGPRTRDMDMVSLSRLNQRTVKLILAPRNPGEEYTIAIPGQHVALSHTTATDAVTREYTPVTSEELLKEGKMELIIRLVPNGAMSKILESFMSGTVEEAGRVFKVTLSADGLTYIPNEFEHLILVAAGTGITPFINLIRAVLNNPLDNTAIKLLFVNRAKEDEFGSDVLNTFSQRGRFEWTLRTGGDRLTAGDIGDMLKDMKRDSMKLFLSGPRTFVKELDIQCRSQLGLSRAQVHSFGFSDR
jgi:NAD(P)H-flavin reductase